MCWDKHHQTTFLSNNFLFISIQHEISGVVHFNACLQTNIQTTLDRLTAHRVTIRITCHSQPGAAGYILNQSYELTVIHSLMTYCSQCIPQDFPLVINSYLTGSTGSSDGSTNTSAQCDSIRIEQNNRRIIECTLGWDTAATQAPVSPPWWCYCSHQKYDPGYGFKQST